MFYSLSLFLICCLSLDVLNYSCHSVRTPCLIKSLLTYLLTYLLTSLGGSKYVKIGERRSGTLGLGSQVSQESMLGPLVHVVRITSDDLCVPAVRLPILLDVVVSLLLALVFGTLFLPTSLQHLLCSLSENV